MPLVHEPKPLPSELDYRPEKSELYAVRTGDSFSTLAKLPQMQFAQMTAMDLCYFNFKTRKPAEINWYLKNKVGCETTTRDGKYYVFSHFNYPGIIYLPIMGTYPGLEVEPAWLRWNRNRKD